MTIYEWRCRRCGALTWCRKKDEPGKFVRLVPTCPKCKCPTMDGTGASRKRKPLWRLL